jgi:hypothetical protein
MMYSVALRWLTVLCLVIVAEPMLGALAFAGANP